MAKLTYTKGNLQELVSFLMERITDFELVIDFDAVKHSDQLFPIFTISVPALLTYSFPTEFLDEEKQGRGKSRGSNLEHSQSVPSLAEPMNNL